MIIIFELRDATQRVGNFCRLMEGRLVGKGSRRRKIIMRYAQDVATGVMGKRGGCSASISTFDGTVATTIYVADGKLRLDRSFKQGAKNINFPSLFKFPDLATLNFFLTSLGKEILIFEVFLLVIVFVAIYI